MISTEEISFFKKIWIVTSLFNKFKLDYSEKIISGAIIRMSHIKLIVFDD